jgi:hypothetical protein
LLTLVARGEPRGVTLCHCLACQARTGSTYSVQASFDSGSVTISGESREYVRIGDGGSRARFSFCPNCGATVHYSIDGSNAIAVPVGAFGDPNFPAPTVSVYEERMHGWVGLPDDVKHIF